MRKTLITLLFLLGFAIISDAQVITPIVAGVVTADVGRNSNFKVIVSQTITSVVLTSGSAPPGGAEVTFYFTENATGGFSVAFGGNITNPCTVTTTASTTTICQFQYDATQNIWFGLGGGSGGASVNVSNAAPSMAFYLSNGCLPANLGNCFNTPADTQEANDCGWTTSNGVITCTGSHFVAGDVGKSVMGFQTCAADQNQTISTGGAIAPNAAMPTITVFTSATSVTISATPANAQTINASFPQGGCFIWGHTDDAGAVLVDAALALAPQCPKLFLAASYYLFTSPHFFTNPAACAQISPGIGVGFGNTTLPAGFEVEGRGTGPTAIYLATNFPNGDACTHTPTTAGLLTPAHTGACFVVPLMGKWSDFRIDGGGQGAPTALSSHTLIYAAVGTIANFSCINYGGYTGGAATGIEMSNLVQLYHVNNAGCGVIALWQDSGSSQSVGYRVITENNNANGLFIAGTSGLANVPSFTCYLCYFSMPQTPLTGFGSVRNNGGIFRWIGGTANPTNIVTTVGNTITGYTATAAGSVLYADHVNFIYNLDPGGTHLNSAVICTAACTNHFHDSTLGSQSSGFDIQDVAGSVEDDLGGNTVTPRMSISGSQVGDASITGTLITAAKLVLSGSWGASAAWTALTGNTRSIQGTITNTGAGQAASPTITYTFPTPFWSATNLVCSAVQVGGTQALVATANFTPSALSATGVTFTYNGTPTVNLTEIVQINCGVK